MKNIRIISIIFPLLFLCGFSYSESNSEYIGITIQYTGSSDRPVDSIIISTSQENAQFLRSTVLRPDEQVFALLASVNIVSKKSLHNISSNIQKFMINKGINDYKIPRINQVIRITIVCINNKYVVNLNKKYGNLMLESLINSSKINRRLKNNIIIFRRNAALLK